DTDQSGVYRVTLGGDPHDYLFAVNVPTATDSQQACESDLTRTEPDELRRAYPQWDMQIVTDLKDVRHTGGVGGSDTDNEPRRLTVLPSAILAPWLLRLMLLLIVLEVILAWVFGHYTSAASQGEVAGSTGRLDGWLAGSLVGVGLLF